MNNPPYFPSTLAEQLAWFNNFSALITATPATYGLVAGDAVTIAAAVTPLQAAYDLAADPATRTTVTVSAREGAWANAKSVCFPFAVTISQDVTVSAANKLAVGVTARSTVRTIVPTPTAVPVLAHVSSASLRAIVTCTNSETPGRKAAPLGCTTDFYWSVGTVAATDPEQLKYQGKRTRFPTEIEFNAGDRAKIVTIAARYSKRNGTAGEEAAGPWSDLIHFTVI